MGCETPGLPCVDVVGPTGAAWRATFCNNKKNSRPAVEFFRLEGGGGNGFKADQGNETAVT